MEELDSISLQTAIIDDVSGSFTSDLIKRLRASKETLRQEFAKVSTDKNLSESQLNQLVVDALVAAESVLVTVWEEVHEQSSLDIS